MKVGDKFVLTDEAVDNYGEEYRDRVFTVTYVSRNTDDHPGYDTGVGELLYDAEDFGNSVYEYEVEQV